MKVRLIVSVDVAPNSAYTGGGNMSELVSQCTRLVRREYWPTVVASVGPTDGRWVGASLPWDTTLLAAALRV